MLPLGMIFQCFLTFKRSFKTSIHQYRLDICLQKIIFGPYSYRSFTQCSLCSCSDTARTVCTVYRFPSSLEQQR
uniref:Uncharacterized protein n=1 Tax=Anguilla anguilla TaxID=7936 RepID=A0A0E9PKU2_ANGAN